jgi:replicative DNA helicase
MDQKIDRPYGAITHAEGLRIGLKYINDRRKGRIKSLKTPWDAINNATIGGIEWGSLVTIGARPAAGKTMFISHILRESKRLNPDQDFSILEFQFEMGDESYAAREYAAQVAMDYNVVLSSKKQLDNFAFQQMENYLKDAEELEKLGIQRIRIKKPLTSADMKKAIHHYFNELGGKPMIVTIDHSWLVKKAADEREKLQTLYNIADMLIDVKRDLPVIVIILTQLNRTMEDVSRRTPGTIANYPSSSDIFGGDALMQGSDLVFAISRPFTLNIEDYGPEHYQANKENVFLHLLKLRNGSTDENIIFLQTDFKRQRMIESPPPPMVQQQQQTWAPRGPRTNRQTPSADVGQEL